MTSPKFKVGDKVVIRTSTPGHDRHNPKDVFTILQVWTLPDTYPPSYLLKHSPSVWPESRLTRI